MAEVWAGFAILQCLLLVVFTAWLVRYFALNGMPMLYMVFCHVGWVLGFAGTLLLPIDIAQAADPSRSSDVLGGFWAFVYWTTFILTWLVLPFFQEYSAAGQFTVKGKTLESIKQNLIFYGAIGVCAIGFLIWIIAANNIGKDDLAPFMFTLATTFGLLIIVVMLGYGLVEVPRLIWRMSDAEAALRREWFKAPDLDQDAFDAVCTVAGIVEEVRSVKARLPPSNTPEGLNMLRCYETVLAKSEAVNRTFSESFQPQFMSEYAQQPPETITEKYLARLHFRLKKESARCVRTQHRMDSCVKDCAIYEAIIAKHVPPSVQNTAAGSRRSWLASLGSVIVWRWRLHYMSWANKFIAAGCAFMSIVILWCESVQPFNSNLSLLGGTLKSVDSFMWKHIVSLVSLLYLCWCTFLSVFRLKLFGLLELSGNRQTDAYSLMFNAAFMCRLQFAISFNFIQLTATNDTAFEKSVGKNMVLFKGINIYIPVIIGAFALLTLLNTFERVLRLLGIDQKGSPRKGNPDDEDKINEGRSLVARARQRTEQKNRGVAALTATRNRDPLNFDLANLPANVDATDAPTSEGSGGRLSGWFTKITGGNSGPNSGRNSPNPASGVTPSSSPSRPPASTSAAAAAASSGTPGRPAGVAAGSSMSRLFGFGGSAGAPSAAHDVDVEVDQPSARSKLYNPPAPPLRHTVYAPKQSLSSFMSGSK